MPELPEVETTRRGVAPWCLGEVVEEGETAALFAHPRHPYTRALLEAEPTGRKAPPACQPVGQVIVVLTGIRRVNQPAG